MGRDEEIIYRARFAFIEGEFQSEVALVVRGGSVAEILRDREVKRRVDARSRVVDLGDVALIPGQINVHSHAFQRSLRGRTEYRQPGDADDFWTWREAMYQLAHRVGPDEMEIIARMAFLEMARSGITHVGEFHYLHHRPEGDPYDDPNEMAHPVIRAAREVGIRITLLPVAYHTGDIGESARPEQRRFVDGDVEDFLKRVRGLSDEWAGVEGVDVGLALHSIRAVPREWMEAVAEEAKAQSMPVHIHVCEQRKEVEKSREIYGVPPVEALYQWGVLDSSWTLIHGTHLSKRELEILEEVRPTIGACPTTERNLGDGFLPARELVARQVPIALGSDSHTVIDPFEEMRLVEYHERLRAEERNVLVAADPEGRTKTAQILWPMGTSQGARSLDCEGGQIRQGGPADLVAIDLEHPSLAGAGASTLLSDVVLSMSSGAVRDVIVGGQSVVAQWRHGREHRVISEYRELMRRW